MIYDDSTSRLNNLKEFDYNSHSLKIKIKNYCDKFPEFNEIDVLNEIKNNKMFRACFIKEPNKQNYYENTAYNYLKKLEETNHISNLKRLPSYGFESLYVKDGEIKTIKEIKKFNINKQNYSKSIDFKFNYKNLTCYITHKYTKGCGGSQDNQYDDLFRFIKHSRNCEIDNNGDKCIFIVIADGDYYIKKSLEKQKNKTDEKIYTTKLEKLNKEFKNNGFNGFACQIENLLKNLNLLNLNELS